MKNLLIMLILAVLLSGQAIGNSVPPKGQVDQIAKLSYSSLGYGYEFYFDGGDSFFNCYAYGNTQKVFEATYKKDDLVADLSKLADWMEISKTAKQKAKKILYFGEVLEGRKPEFVYSSWLWEFTAKSNGKSVVETSFSPNCKGLKFKPKHIPKIRGFIADINENYKTVKEKHFSIKDPFD